MFDFSKHQLLLSAIPCACGNVLFFTRHTLVWRGTKFALFLSTLSGYRYIGDGGVDRREILHDGTYRWRTGLGAPRDPQIRHFGANFGHLNAHISKTVSSHVTCELQLKISSTGAF